MCGAEFGRMENRNAGKDNPFAGRDHSVGGITVWMAGGGVKGGLTYLKNEDGIFNAEAQRRRAEA